MSFISRVTQKIIGTKNDRRLKQLKPIIDQINSLVATYKAMDDTTLKSQTAVLRDSLKAGSSLDDILPQAFAVVRETATRTLGLRHYDVQLIAGIALHNGWIAEAKTGEGKTLTATAPAYLNALTHQGVHVIVPNAYLAKRDAKLMSPIFEFLGISIDVADNDQPFHIRKQAYEADITYTTNHTLGFDYLRDNMRISNEQLCLRKLAYCIIDEADSILIDEARTPLIITGPVDDSSELYAKIYQLTSALKYDEKDPQDLTILHKEKQVHLTEQGHDHINTLLIKNHIIAQNSDLYDTENIKITHYINACLRGRYLFHKDVDYVVENNQVIIIDASTGRKASGRRWSDGLHQALEAKEGVSIQKENQTLASITYQNLFRLYPKISGMTGTADTEASELNDIYNLIVLVVPTNKPMVRQDLPDQIYITEAEKTESIMNEVETRHAKGQPILIGTTSIEGSERLSTILQKKGIKHNVLNAKNHAKEAEIIAQAGQLGSVTIATNMAGRGTDIILGGDPATVPNWKEAHQKVIEAGGLHVLGSERHESRRIDNQLRGRSGRQGDIGSSQFYLSLDDMLMKRFASEQMKYIMRSLGMKKGENLSAPMLNRSIENAQHNIEAYYYEQRKNVLQLDNVANDQRSIVYQQRNELIELDDIADVINDIAPKVSKQIVSSIQSRTQEIDKNSIPHIQRSLQQQLHLDAQITPDINMEQLEEQISQLIVTKLLKQRELFGDGFPLIEKRCLLSTLDQCWKDHLSAMDHLRMGIGLRRYAQKNPIHEFKSEALTLFNSMLDKVRYATIQMLCTAQPKAPEPRVQSGSYSVKVSTPLMKQKNNAQETI